VPLEASPGLAGASTAASRAISTGPDDELRGHAGFVRRLSVGRVFLAAVFDAAVC